MVDPAPTIVVAGIYTCNNCPNATSNDYVEGVTILTNFTSKSFSGTVSGAIGDGVWYLEALCEYYLLSFLLLF